MTTNKRALVIGGSIGGLCAGHLLLRSGWDATVFERSEGNLADRGAGLGVSTELFDIMRRAGVTPGKSLSLKVSSSIWLDQDGKIAHELPISTTGSAWPVIYQPLRAAFPSANYQAGKELVKIEQNANSVTTIFADGTSETGDILVAADGVNSIVRRQFSPDTRLEQAGYVVWRGIIEEKDIPPKAEELLLDRLSFSFPEGEQIISRHVPGRDKDIRVGHRRYYFAWYCPADPEKQSEILTDSNGRHHGLTIPPPLIRPEVIAELREAAQTKLSLIMADIITRAEQPLVQSVTDLDSSQLVFGHVAIMGDAAFVARPHVAAGATKAALDAAWLTDALANNNDEVDAGLAQYERDSCKFGQSLVAHSRYLGTYLEAQLKPTNERGAAGTRDPIKLMSDYGAPHLVHREDVK